MTADWIPASAGMTERAAIYELLSRLLSPPDPEHGERAIRIAFALGRSETVPAALLESFRTLTDALARLSRDEIERDWQATFGLTDSGPISLCETEYGMAHVFQKSNTLADIAGFYRAFGLDRADGAERPDHLSVEFEFLSILAMKEYLAAKSGRADAAELTRAAERLFLSEHTGRFAPGLFKRMRDSEGFYAVVAESALEAMSWLMAEHGIGMPDQLAYSGPKAPEEPLACGQCQMTNGQ